MIGRAKENSIEKLTYSTEPMIRGIIRWKRQRIRRRNGHLRWNLSRTIVRSTGRGEAHRRQRRSESDGEIPRIAARDVEVTNIPLGAFGGRSRRTVPKALLGVVQSDPAPIMIGGVVAHPPVSRSARSSRALFRGTPPLRLGYVSIPVTEFGIAVGVGEAFLPVGEVVAFLVSARGTVLAILTVRVVPFEAAEKVVFGAAGPRASLDEEKQRVGTFESGMEGQ